MVRIKLAFATCFVAAFLGSQAAPAATFDDPASHAGWVSGTTPSGLLWTSVATGTALPVRTSGTNPLNGQAGAVAYFRLLSGIRG